MDGVNYGLGFPGGEIDNEDNWLPANSGEMNFISGAALNLSGKKNGPCNGRITQNYKITVTKN